METSVTVATGKPYTYLKYALITLAVFFGFFYAGILFLRIVPKKNLAKTYHTKWVFITGATGGIGSELLNEVFIRQNLNVIVCTRNEEKGLKLKKEYMSKLPEDTKQRFEFIIHDHDNEAQNLLIDRLNAKIEELEIPDDDLNVAFINAGYGDLRLYNDPENDIKRKNRFVNTNLLQYLTLSDFFYNRFLIAKEAKKEKGWKKIGALCMTSSIMDSCPLPSSVLYHGCKSYISATAQCLFAEGRNLGIDVIAVKPGPVDQTGFYSRGDKGLRIIYYLSKIPFTNIVPKNVVTCAFKSIGYVALRPVGFTAWFLEFLYRYLPRNMYSWMATALKDIIA